MAKRMSDDDVMNYVYGKLFGDLDGIESHALFDEEPGKMGAIEGEVENAKPESQSSGGVKVTIEPIMAAAQEGEKMTADEDDEDEEDKLKGIGQMSPLMAQLHGTR